MTRTYLSPRAAAPRTAKRGPFGAAGSAAFGAAQRSSTLAFLAGASVVGVPAADVGVAGDSGAAAEAAARGPRGATGTRLAAVTAAFARPPRRRPGAVGGMTGGGRGWRPVSDAVGVSRPVRRLQMPLRHGQPLKGGMRRACPTMGREAHWLRRWRVVRSEEGRQSGRRWPDLRRKRGRA